MGKSDIEPQLLVVFGGTGDLIHRKLLPALYHLSRQGRLREFRMLAVARNAEHDDGSYRRWASDALHQAEIENGENPDGIQNWSRDHLHYQSLGPGSPDEYRELAKRMEDLDRQAELSGNRVLYLALPPSAFAPTIERLGEVGLNRSSGWTRLVIEKPFGRDLASAGELNQVAHRHFEESEIYRIDHYLGKETVQNLLVLRFANPLFESSWNRDRVESVRITVAEDLGVEQRGSYYDKTGALRDMVQNHLTQLLALTAMEVPANFEADAIRDEKVKVLRSVAPIRPGDAVFGQYLGGKIGDEEVPAYREERDVGSDSSTETFVAMRLRVENWRWQGVPFYLVTGKRLGRRLTRIEVRFRCPPVGIFYPSLSCRIHSNALIVTLQPDEGFDLLFEVKSPKQEITMETQRLRFRYAEAFEPLADAYETLLLDAAAGDQTLFVRGDEVEASWKLYTPLLEQDIPVHPYPAGSSGPEESERLLGG